MSMRKKKIEIIDIKKNVFGMNPLLPYSTIIWKEKKNRT